MESLQAYTFRAVGYPWRLYAGVEGLTPPMPMRCVGTRRSGLLSSVARP